MVNLMPLLLMLMYIIVLSFFHYPKATAIAIGFLILCIFILSIGIYFIRRLKEHFAVKELKNCRFYTKVNDSYWFLANTSTLAKISCCHRNISVFKNYNNALKKYGIMLKKIDIDSESNVKEDALVLLLNNLDFRYLKYREFMDKTWGLLRHLTVNETGAE